MKTTSKVEIGQFALIFVSLLATTILLLFTLFYRTFNIELLSFLGILFLIFLNIIYSKIYTINFSSDSILISNLYKKIKLEKNAFLSIDIVYESVNFFVPIPLSSPPYFVLKTKDGQKYIFVIKSIKSIFESFIITPRTQAKELEKNIKSFYNIHD